MKSAYRGRPFRLPRGYYGPLGKGNVNRLHAHFQQIVIVARHGALEVIIDLALIDPGNAHCRRVKVTLLAIQRALELGGVEFIDGDEPGIRVRTRK